MLDLGLEVQWFNTHWGNILLHSKASDANIGIIANFVSQLIHLFWLRVTFFKDFAGEKHQYFMIIRWPIS